MIPLRVLHLLPPDGAGAPAPASGLGGAEVQSGAALVAALTAFGQAACIARPRLPGVAAASGELAFATSWFRWWRGGRRAAAEAVDAWTPDLIHVHREDLLGAGIDLARDLRLPLVASLHREVDPLAGRRLRDHRVAFVVVPTEHHRAWAVGRLGLAKERLAVVPPPPLSPVTVRPPSGAIGPEWHAGAVAWGGDPLGEGGIDRFLRALAEVQGSLSIQGAVLVDAPWAEAVRAAAHRLRAAVRVVPGRDLPGFLQGLHILVCPSRRETHPWLPISAMAAGLPVVGEAAGAFPELVRDGSTALLMAGAGVAPLAAALRTLHDRQTRRDLGAAGARLAAERYVGPAIATAVDAVHRAALSATFGGAPSQGSGSRPAVDATRAWRRITGSNLPVGARQRTPAVPPEPPPG